jgi:hypothetical protein
VRETMTQLLFPWSSRRSKLQQYPKWKRSCTNYILDWWFLLSAASYLCHQRFNNGYSTTLPATREILCMILIYCSIARKCVTSEFATVRPGGD